MKGKTKLVERERENVGMLNNYSRRGMCEEVMEAKDGNKRKGEIAEVLESGRRGGGEREMKRKDQSLGQNGTQ